MEVLIKPTDARRLLHLLLNNPIAPGNYSHFINVGTDHILKALEENYFQSQLADGIGCFKYLEGDYGSGKTQFINSLAQRASENKVVTALVTVGAECPFNSPVAIFRGIMGSFQPPADPDRSDEAKGIELLIDDWIVRRIRELGADPDGDIPDNVVYQIERQIGGLWKGAPDPQMAIALRRLSRRLLEMKCGATDTVSDSDLIAWIRGENIRSPNLKHDGIYEPARDDNAFRRLKTTIAFLRTRMGYRGFLIAFDEGTRVTSFRRGSTKQRQAVENLLTMINQNADGEFGGVMFMYAATPDFRSEVIHKYRALQDRIGTHAFSKGSPLVPLIKIEDANTEDVIYSIGKKLLAVFGKAYDIVWEEAVQATNMHTIFTAEKERLFETPNPRFFVYQYCRFLNQQRESQHEINVDQANDFVNNNEPPLGGDDE